MLTLFCLFKRMCGICCSAVQVGVVVTLQNPNPRRDRCRAFVRRVPQMHKTRNLLNKISFDTIKFPIKI
ncbi:hypothetical protein SLEP1_g30769 [Rubroshorea leprosula]|uniref:Secreted protein n=1 Tax=Rubroshorea leprosula TaxID=152421 RepID=A0AAV5K3L8_9ROSI|nr:hypothetical protein SLEP1_g30769 [Rubroshorea leprosula]